MSKTTIFQDGKIYHVVEKKPKKKTPKLIMIFLFFLLGSVHPMGGVMVLGFWILLALEAARENKKNGY